MNKKFSTLLAGALLAGAVLSPAMAVQLTKVADNGKYYKMERGAFVGLTNGDIPTGGAWTSEGATGRFLGLNASGAAALIQNGGDYWKVVSVGENTYELINFNGDKLTVNDKTVFGLHEAFNAANETAANGFTQLNQDGSTWIGYDSKTFALKTQDDRGVAFDAVESSELATDVTGFNTSLEGQDAIYFIYNNKGSMTHTNTVFNVSYDKSTKTYTFTFNKTGEALIATGTNANVKSFYVSSNHHGAYLQDPTSKSYVKLTFENGEVTGATLVDAAEEATYVGFKFIADPSIPAEALNVLEKDGFSVTIYYDKEDDCLADEDHLATDIASNPFKGHLTTMVWNGSSFKTPESVAGDNDEFYLKNSDGNYIVAQKYEGQGSLPSQALYSFTTVKEADLKHYLTRKAQGLEVEVEYFGVFSAVVNGVDFDADPNAITKVDKLQLLYVKVGDGVTSWALVGRYDFTTNKVPTLVASQSTVLYPILISLGDREIVDWTTFIQGKFFTVKKTASATATDPKGYLLAKSNRDGYDFESSYGNELEAEWALTVEFSSNGKAETYVFTNRENPTKTFTLPAQTLYYVSGAEDTYKQGGDKYEIKAVETEATDGYKVLATDKELNQKWNIAFASSVFDGKAYMTENHGESNSAAYHVIGLTTDVANALEFSVKKYDGKFEKKENTTKHQYEYYPADTIYVISELGVYNTKKKIYDTVEDTLKVLAYTFVNQWNEPLTYGAVNANNEQGYRSAVNRFAITGKTDDKAYKYGNKDLEDSHADAQKFAIRFDGDNYNLRPVEFSRKMQQETSLSTNWEEEMYQVFNQNADLVKIYAGDASKGILSNTDLYQRTENDLFAIEQTDADIYRRLQNDVDTVSIYRNDNSKSLLYENATEIATGVFANFLGMDNIADLTDLNPAMLADTAYVRNDTYKPQYMLVVGPTIHPAGKWCEEHQSATCEHAVPVPAWTEGRFLVNLVDSANVWDNAHVHQVGNPYKNTEGYYKLGFVQATHRNDSLIVNGKRQFIGNNDNHIAKFQFRYADADDQSFVIETSLDGTQTPGYLKWMNGVVVVVDDIKNADIYNMNEEENRQPTANETIAASEVTVIAGEGQVTIAGAAGKKVVISNILGQVVANTILTSDNAAIAAPQGVVVVAVEGEAAVKAIVK